MKKYAIAFGEGASHLGRLCAGPAMCVTTGRTRAETRSLIAEAIQRSRARTHYRGRNAASPTGVVRGVTPLGAR
jgi:hypothetical protein